MKHMKVVYLFRKQYLTMRIFLEVQTKRRVRQLFNYKMFKIVLKTENKALINLIISRL